jgi:aconitate hydratase
MTRGTFANVRVKNRIAAERRNQPEGGWTRNFTKGDTLADAPVEYIYDAAMDYKQAGTPLVVHRRQGLRHGLEPRLGRQGHDAAGREGGDRRVVRAHPPLEPGVHGRAAVRLQGRRKRPPRSASTGDESFDIELPVGCRAPPRTSPSRPTRPDGSSFEFQAMLRIDTAVELEYSRNGGILQTVIRKKLNEAKQWRE